MQIAKKDLKKGILSLKPQSLDDLWHLERVLEPGDLVRARTLRRVELRRGEEVIKGERRPVTLTLELEKIGFHPDTGKLRLAGKIREGPPDMPRGSHHTIQVEPDLLLTVQKAWKKHHLDRLEKARIKEPLLLICTIDRDGADFAALKASGVEMLGSKRFKKVLGEEKREAFYQEIIKHLEAQTGYQAIILAGPGFEAENLLAHMKEKAPGLAAQVSLERASHTGRTGVQEVIKRSANRVLARSRVSRETRLVEELLAEMARDGKAVYGKGETEKALGMGAVETLLVSEQKVAEFEPLMEKAEAQRGKIVIISTTHEAGERFLSLGGIAGLLRFKL